MVLIAGTPADADGTHDFAVPLQRDAAREELRGRDAGNVEVGLALGQDPHPEPAARPPQSAKQREDELAKGGRSSGSGNRLDDST